MRFQAKDVTRWHKVFAWVPRRVGTEWVWLETCWRRYRQQQGVSLYHHPPPHWEYSLVSHVTLDGQTFEVTPG